MKHYNDWFLYAFIDKPKKHGTSVLDELHYGANPNKYLGTYYLLKNLKHYDISTRSGLEWYPKEIKNWQESSGNAFTLLAKVKKKKNLSPKDIDSDLMSC